ncbi:MAG: 3-isopropylmalate dehydratase small subunit [Pigmentiphaga sp.]
MERFVSVTGIAAPMPAANTDTDVIMPKQFLKGVDRSGLDRGLFHNLRFDAAGQEIPGFVLNQTPWREARFLVVGENFGCGSSREHAVWGLRQRGIRGLIGTSFAGIFFDNCARNGLLAITVGEAALARIMECASNPQANRLTIDLPSQSIEMSGCAGIRFDIDTPRKEALIEGRDAIGETLRYQEDIKSFEHSYLRANPWLL